MKTATLTRDDSALSYSLFASLVIHALLVLFFGTPDREKAPPTEHVYPTAVYQVFPDDQKFLTFDASTRVYSTSSEGVSEPNAGSIEVAAKDFTPTNDNRKVGVNDPRVLEGVEERKFYGQALEAGEEIPDAPSQTAEVAPTTPRRLLEMPEGPEGIIRDYEPVPRTQMASAAADGQSAPSSGGTIRSGSAASAEPTRRPGVLDAPTPSRVNPSTTHRGEVNEPRQYSEPRSQGRNVAEDPRELTGPEGAPSTPSKVAGRRKLLYSPEPVYPEWAERERVRAQVKFHLLVSPSGHVTSVRLAAKSGYPELDRLAERKVRQWLYEPRPGQVQEVVANVRFQLRGSELEL